MNTLLLTGGPLVLADAVNWNDNGLMSVIAAAMKVIAVLVLLLTIFSATKNIRAGKAGAAAVWILGCLLVLAPLWNPALISKALDTSSSVTNKGLDTVNTIVDQSGSGATTGTTGGK